MVGLKGLGRVSSYQRLGLRLQDRKFGIELGLGGLAVILLHHYRITVPAEELRDYLAMSGRREGYGGLQRCLGNNMRDKASVGGYYRSILTVLAEINL